MMWTVLWWAIEHWLLVVGMVAIIAAFFIGGWRLALAVGTLGASAAAYHYGRTAGARAELAKQASERQRAQQARKETDDEIENLGAADVDQRLARWLRDSDG